MASSRVVPSPGMGISRSVWTGMERSLPKSWFRFDSEILVAFSAWMTFCWLWA